MVDCHESVLDCHYMVTWCCYGVVKCPRIVIGCRRMMIKSRQMMMESLRFVQFFACHEAHLSCMVSIDRMVLFFLRGAASSLKGTKVALCMLSISVTLKQ